jgi:hypothetical protein
MVTGPHLQVYLELWNHEEAMQACTEPPGTVDAVGNISSVAATP